MLITRSAEFSASHVCRNPALTDEENQAVYGAESNPHGHGHNFVLEVTLEGEPDPSTGMVYDLKRLKAVLESEIIQPFDHRFLNFDVAPFDRVIPTPENLAIEIWKRLDARLREPGIRLRSVRIRESADFYVEYDGAAS
jgi:6-pyruvoyltetrahydropterin/6-carboxytetrahydropterin synthase